MLAYFCIVLSATIGYFNGPWWTALLCGLALALMSIGEQQKLRARFVAVDATDVLVLAGLASMANGCLAAAAAYVMGRVIGWALPL